MPAYTIGRATPEQLSSLAAIGLSAAELFAEEDLPRALAESPTPLEALRSAQAAGLLWVAAAGADRVLGFALVRFVEGHPHLQELDVAPAHGRQGIGTALLHAVCDWAHSAGHSRLTLTTFEHVSWNAPFYARHGFLPISPGELSDALADILAEEARSGLDPRRRVAMERPLETKGPERD